MVANDWVFEYFAFYSCSIHQCIRRSIPMVTAGIMAIHDPFVSKYYQVSALFAVHINDTWTRTLIFSIYGKFTESLHQADHSHWKSAHVLLPAAYLSDSPACNVCGRILWLRLARHDLSPSYVVRSTAKRLWIFIANNLPRLDWCCCDAVSFVPLVRQV